MGIYIVLGIILAGIVGGYAYFYIKRIFTFVGVNMSRRSSRMICFCVALAVAAACVNVWSVTALIVLHILAASVFCDLCFLIFRKMYKRQDDRIGERVSSFYRSGLIPVIITAMLLGYGFYNMGHVVKTEYQITTEKNVNDYRIALITDTHYGTIQDPKLLDKAVEELNQEKLDIVILGGDIVEEDTSKEEMQQAFQVLGGIETSKGIYYVYGNHDRQPYTDQRSYTDEELIEAVEENHITILEDSYVEINEELILAGRGNAMWGNSSGRKSMEGLLQGVDRNHYIITADHQPIQAEENDAQGVDLEVSGHTHAGQIWPVGWLSELTGILNYGEYQKGDCKVIVSSGFTGWGYPLRTEGHCEYVIIHLSQSS
ncbi:MAG: metallophosphoesterase [Eubacteriales bacterium]|nr:metallophosphoesterase [Eubacteriales bacterium]